MEKCHQNSTSLNLHQIVYEFMLMNYSYNIFKGIIDPDNNFQVEFNPPNAEATFVQCTKMQRFSKTI